MRKIFSIPIERFEIEDTITSNLAKVRIHVTHDGLNYNNLIITESALEFAKPSIANIPLLAFVKKDQEEQDFGGHEVEQKWVTEDGKLKFKERFLEQPIGLVPETNNYTTEIINDETWVVVDGYVWKSYSNEAYEILKRDGAKNVSMEIETLEDKVDENTGIYTITKFNYMGITVLGDDVPPAMGEEAKIEMFSKNNKKEYFSKVEELKEELKNEQKNEVNDLSTENKHLEDGQIEKPVTKMSAEGGETKEPELPAPQEPTPVEPTPAPVEPTGEPTPVEPVEPKEPTPTPVKTFSTEGANSGLSVNYITQQIDLLLEDITELKAVWWEDNPIPVPLYYRVDLLYEDEIVIVSNYDYTGFFGIPYTITNDVIELQLDQKTEYISMWKQKDLGGNIATFSTKNKVMKKLLEGGKEAYTNLKTKFSALEEEAKGLREFKSEIDKKSREAEIDNKIAEFDLTDEEKQEVRNLAFSRESMSVEDLEKELFAIEGRKAMEEKKRFSQIKNEEGHLVKKIAHSEPEETSRYGSALIYFK